METFSWSWGKTSPHPTWGVNRVCPDPVRDGPGGGPISHEPNPESRLGECIAHSGQAVAGRPSHVPIRGPLFDRDRLAAIPLVEREALRGEVAGFAIGELADGGRDVRAVLEGGCDCLGVIRYLDGYVADDHGHPVRIPNVICMHEEDFGILWKHTDRRLPDSPEVRNALRLALARYDNFSNSNPVPGIYQAIELRQQKGPAYARAEPRQHGIQLGIGHRSSGRRSGVLGSRFSGHGIVYAEQGKKGIKRVGGAAMPHHPPKTKPAKRQP